MHSIWEEGQKANGFAALDRNIRTEVLVIGGGLCGLLCAYLLHQAGIDYVLAEAETVCGGITRNTTAKITAQHGLIYSQLADRFGLEKAKQYLDANETARKRLCALAEQLDCELEYRDSYVYARSSREKLIREIRTLEELNFPAELCDSLPLPFPVTGAVKFAGQAQFHPLKFAAELSKDLHIYEQTRVRELIGTKAVTDGGTIEAKNILVTTHFPFLNKHGAFFLKLYQQRSYVLALKGAPLPDGMYVDEAQNGLSFRQYQDVLLLGGGGHRTGKRGGNWKELREFAQKYYPQAAECGHWATQDCMSLDGIPYIGPYSTGTEGLYVATGFNKWGMTSSMAAALLLTDQLRGKDDPNRELFSPSRSILRPQLAVNAWESLTNLLTPSAKRCPHLGCALKWNSWEQSWDCPCHGSRFTQDGRLIDNPATGDLK